MKKSFLTILFFLIPTIVMATELSHPKHIGKFSLTDTDERPFTEASLVNQWTLVFFGYTTCFSVCPKTLTTVSKTWQLLPETLTQQSLRFVFITLDPKADTSKQLKAFLERFNPSFIGVTGAETTIQQLSKRLGIYSYEDTDAGQKIGTKIIDHSASLLLINPKGQLQAVFSPPHDPENLAKELTELSTGH